MADLVWDTVRIRERIELEASHLPLTAAIDAMHEMADEYQQLVDQLSADKTQLQTSVTELQAGVVALQEKITALQSEAATATAALTANQQTVATQKTQIAGLEQQLFRALHPADVYVSRDLSQFKINRLRQGLDIVTNEFFPASKAAAVDKMAPYTNALYAAVSYHLSNGFGVGDAWNWDGTGTRPSAPNNLGPLQTMANLATRLVSGKPHLITVFGPPWHMKRQRDRLLTAAEQWGSAGTGRLSGEFKEDWKLTVEECFVTAATEILEDNPTAIIWCQIHNEYKGMYELLNKAAVVRGQNWADGANPGNAGYGDIDYIPYYRLCIEGVRRGMTRLKLSEDRVKFCGPYIVCQSEGVRDADAVPVGHPLADRVWGQGGKAPANAVARFISDVKAQNLPLAALIVDGGTHNRDNVFLTDAFGQATKLSDWTLYVRALLDGAGYSETEIWWSECYRVDRPKPGATTITAEQDTMSHRAMVHLLGLATLAWAGAGLVFQWNMRGEDGDPYLVKENAAVFRADGSPTAIYTALKVFNDAFPPGCRLYALTLEGAGVGGLASDDHILLYNKTAKTVTAAVGTAVYSLPPDGWLII